MVTTIVLLLVNLSEQDISVEKRNQNYLLNIGLVENYGQGKRDQRSPVHQAENVNTEKEKR